MKVFMLGWEFPPYISGGLGTACAGLTRGLNEAGVEVAFVLPMALPHDASSHVTFRTPTTLMQPGRRTTGKAGQAKKGDRPEAARPGVTMHVLPAILQPYGTPAGYEQAMKKLEELRKQGLSDVAELLGASGMPAELFAGIGPGGYGGDLMGQVSRYASLAVRLASNETFDVIHAHDWMTYPAGLATSAYTGKPLVVHVHSTEFDRSGENVNQEVYNIERAGMHGAERVVCVSYLTRSIVLSRYGVPAEKVQVIYNAVEPPTDREVQLSPIRRDEKIVLFLGRITMQKGPEYFLLAAKKVLDKFKKVRFVIAGSGDMIAEAIEMAAELGIGRYVTFTGFLRGDDVARVFQMADLYVMPSVSEPFGIAPLEALSHNVPVIISKQSGVSEVLTHVLKVDFWDVDEMANKILAVLRHPPLQRVLRQQGQIELQKLSWRDSAEQCKKMYEDLVRASA
ncbi:MAG TPA: glycosyltransferase [Phycisphaerae bacterium]|nr:glycosyltransferase [Phycisphaerae bacterium]